MPGDRSARLRAGSQLPDSGHRLPAALSPRSGLGAALLAVVVVVLGTWVARAVTRRGPARHPVTAPSGAPVPRADQPADSAPKDNDNDDDDDDDDEHTTTPARATAPAGAAGDPRPRVRGRAHAAVASCLVVLCAVATILVADVRPLSVVLASVSAVGTTEPAAPAATPTVVEAPPRPDCTRLRCVTLTFDDGPDPWTTPALLDLLESRGVPANFFVLGSLIEGNEHLLRRMDRLGMGVENHTWNHPDLQRLAPGGVTDQLRRTDAEIERVLGAAPRYMRPPYGAWTPGHTPTGGMHPVMWEVDPQDWLYRDSTVVAQKVLDRTRPGDVILLHDIHQTSVDAVPTIIDGLHRRGFTFVTLDDLYAARPDCRVGLYCSPVTRTPATSTPSPAPGATTPPTSPATTDGARP